MSFKKYKIWLFNIIVFLWFIPLIKVLIPASITIKLAPLMGYYQTPIEQPTFSWNRWLDGSFQQLSEKYIEEQIAFRPLFVRLRNQIDFSLYKKSNAQDVAIGKDNYLFSDKYIASYMGTNFIGKKKIDSKVELLHAIRNELKKLNIDLVFVVAPGKGFYYPEYIPDHYRKWKKDSTNYEWYIKAMKEKEINVIDFNAYFIQQKAHAPYPLFSKTGIHWSCYGAALAGDSIVKYLEKLSQIDMPDIIKKGVETSDTARRTDNDIYYSLNLFFNIPNPQLGYLKLAFENNPAKTKPPILTIGDSFYWNIFMDSIPQKVYSSPEFWYYNKQAYLHDKWNPETTFDYEYFRKKIYEQKVIVILQTEGNFDDFGFGFIEKVNNIYKHKDLPIIFDTPETANPLLKQHVESYLGTWLAKRGKKRSYREGLNFLWSKDDTWKNDFKERWAKGYLHYLNGDNNPDQWNIILQQGFSDRNFATYLIPHIIWWANNE